jgi:putative inorganic carbon (hco3(-)) transporter
MSQSDHHQAIVESQFEPGVEAVTQASKADSKRKRRREPLEFVYLGLLVFLLLNFLRPQDYIPGLSSVPLAKITGTLIVLALVFSTKTIRWHVPQEIIFLTLLMIQLWISVACSAVWKGGAFHVMVDFTKALPVVIVIWAAVRSMKRMRTILFVQAASFAAIAIISIAMAHTPGERLKASASGLYGNANDLAFALGLSLPLCLALALTTRSSWKKFAWTVAMLVMVYAVFRTASRGGAIELVVVALVCLWELGIKSRRFYLLLLAPVAILVIGLVAGNGLRERIDQTDINFATGINSSEASAQQRLELLLKSIQVTSEHPLVGVGPGNFTIVSGVWRVTHNSYTEISSEGGIPALILYVLIFWRGIANLRAVQKYKKTEKRIWLFSVALEASLAAYLIGSFFISVAYQFFPYCLVAYTSALRLIAQKDRTAARVTSKPDLESPEAEVSWGESGTIERPFSWG